MEHGTGPQEKPNDSLPVIWAVAGGVAIAYGWSRGWVGVIVFGVACLVVGGGLLSVRRSKRFRKWEPHVNIALFVLTIVALVAVLAADVARWGR